MPKKSPHRTHSHKTTQKTHTPLFHPLIKRILIIFITANITAIILIFIFISMWIGTVLKDTCRFATLHYKGNCNQALIQLLDDPANSFHQRNEAIWALGQLGHRESLAVLNKYYTGVIPVHESVTQGISQHELDKARQLCNGEPNLSAAIWQKVFKTQDSN